MKTSRMVGSELLGGTVSYVGPASGSPAIEARWNGSYGSRWSGTFALLGELGPLPLGKVSGAPSGTWVDVGPVSLRVPA